MACEIQHPRLHALLALVKAHTELRPINGILNFIATTYPLI